MSLVILGNYILKFYKFFSRLMIDGYIKKIYDKFDTKLFQDRGPYHIETSPLICCVNQWTGLYMIKTTVMEELKQYVKRRIICLSSVKANHLNESSLYLNRNGSIMSRNIPIRNFFSILQNIKKILSFFNLFVSNAPFLCHLKTPEILMFSRVRERVYWKRMG